MYDRVWLNTTCKFTTGLNGNIWLHTVKYRMVWWTKLRPGVLTYGYTYDILATFVHCVPLPRILFEHAFFIWLSAIKYFCFFCIPFQIEVIKDWEEKIIWKKPRRNNLKNISVITITTFDAQSLRRKQKDFTF